MKFGRVRLVYNQISLLYSNINKNRNKPVTTRFRFQKIEESFLDLENFIIYEYPIQ